jgi:hypothetical protein
MSAIMQGAVHEPFPLIHLPLFQSQIWDIAAIDSTGNGDLIKLVFCGGELQEITQPLIEIFVIFLFGLFF